ncbi:peptidoglycan-binding protein [Planktomarina temperata]|nr:peptidoglycan-binding protein [Planktomarina temperata]
MHYRLFKIALSLITVFLSAGILSAAECVNNVNSCTPKQLCEAATSTDSGKKVWTTKPSFTEHLKAAKSIGIDCGVVEVIASCNTDAELCTFTEVCKRAIQVNGGKTNWMTTTAAAPYVAIAKKYGMSCGVGAKEIFVETNNETIRHPVPRETGKCRGAPAECSDVELCYRFQKYTNNMEVRSEAKARKLDCKKRIYHLDPASSIDENGLNFGKFPPQAKLTKAPRFNLKALIKGDSYSKRRSYAENKDWWERHLKAGPNFSGKYFLAQYGCGSSCKWYRLIDLTNGAIFRFPYGGEDYWNHDLIFDAGSSLMKIIYPRNDYDKNLHHCVINEFSWIEETKTFRTEKEFIFPKSLGNYCEATNDWKHVNQEFKKWKSSLSAGTNIARKVDNSKIVIQVQKELNRLGCKGGIADGVEGPNTRAAINRFHQNVNAPATKGLPFHQFIKVLRSFPDNACTASSGEELKPNQQIAPASSNSAELQALRLERQQIEANLRAMEELIARQKRAANAPFNSCLTNCQLNNRAGSGFAGLLNGLAQCNNSCAPLKYGGAVTPPSWERNQRRLKTIDCTITQMSKNQATARCNQF